MPQPLAVLNDEEMHWLNDLGLPNQRRWLNHRTLGDDHRRTLPSAGTDISTTPRALSFALANVFSLIFRSSQPRESLPAPPCSFSTVERTFSSRSSISAHSALRAASCE